MALVLGADLDSVCQLLVVVAALNRHLETTGSLYTGQIKALVTSYFSMKI